MWLGLSRGLLSLSALFLVCAVARAAPVSWTIVSSASSIAVHIPNQTLTITSTGNIIFATSQTLSVRALDPGTASASTPTGWSIGERHHLSGILQTDTDFSTYIQFLQSNVLGDTVIAGIDSGLYAPLANGDPGTESGDFGARFFAGLGVLGTVNVDVAIREALYTLTSGSTAVALNGQFPVTGFEFGTDDGVALDYRARDGAGPGGSALVAAIGSASTTVDAISTSNIHASSGNFFVTPKVGGDITHLHVPIGIPYSIPLNADGTLTFKAVLIGTIVATAVVVPEPATSMLLGIGIAMLAPMAVRRWRKRE